MDDILSLTAHIVSAHVSKNEVSTSQLPSLILNVHQALATIGQTVAEPAKAQPAVPAIKSVFPHHIVCLGCGKGFKTLKRHIDAHHGLTPDQYRAKWGLPPSYPMIAPEYAAQRSELSKDSVMAKKAAEPPPTKKRGRPAKGMRPLGTAKRGGRR